jgi:hypothetical protein
MDRGALLSTKSAADPSSRSPRLLFLLTVDEHSPLSRVQDTVRVSLLFFLKYPTPFHIRVI